MTPLLSPTPRTQYPRPRLGPLPFPGGPDASASRAVQVFCGGVLLGYGLLRGSWLGLTLAAAGGFLLYRGLTPLAKPAGRRPDPPRADPQTKSDWSPTVALPPNDARARAEPAAAAPSSFLEAARSETLTPEEHREAEVAAYYRALRRGGGWLPPYEHSKAVEDFCRAAEMVVRQRVGG